MKCSIVPSNSKIIPISIINKKVGKIYTETTSESLCRSFITTKIKNSFGKELAKEEISLKPGTSYGISIEVSPEYQNKGYGLGEILRLFSIMLILENKVKEFLIYSIPTAIFFHSKYKFTPNIIKNEERDYALKSMIKNCDRKYYNDIKLEAEKILKRTEKASSYEENIELSNLTNQLLEKYITRVMNFGNDYDSHPFKYGMEMKLTLENIFDNKDFFNKLFQKHKIDYHI